MSSDDEMSVEGDNNAKTTTAGASAAFGSISASSFGGGENDLSNPEILNKYKLAADILNKALLGVISFCKPDANVSDVCTIGDTLIQKQCEAAFKGIKMDKGAAFPTCISLNNCVCHYSPLSTETVKFRAGDVVKVDIGAQIDGYIAVVAHTFVVPGLPAPKSGRAADVIHAAYEAAEKAVSLIKPGNTNAMITDLLSEVSTAYGVNKVQGVLMHQMKRFIIDGNNVIIAKEDVDQKVESFTFEENGVYTVDVVFTTGAGKPIQRDARTTVFKRAVDQKYTLKLQASKYVLSEMNRKFSTFPFTLRLLDEKQGRLGISELSKHGMVIPYPVLYEKPNDIVAHFKYTILVTDSGIIKLTGAPLDTAAIVRGPEPEAPPAQAAASDSSASGKKGGSKGGNNKKKGKGNDMEEDN